MGENFQSAERICQSHWKLGRGQQDINRGVLYTETKGEMHCLDVTTQPREPESFLSNSHDFKQYMQPIATIGVNIDHFYVLISFLAIKRGKLGFFSKFTSIYVINILIQFWLSLKNRGISRVVLLEIPFLY